MGNLISRRDAGVEEVDIAANNAYKFPPKAGSYFGSHFIMGGVRFDTIQPEAYLFGENADLNFLGNRPIPFPYPAPQAGEPTKMLKSLVNIRKDSIRIVRAAEAEGPEPETAEVKSETDLKEVEKKDKTEAGKKDKTEAGKKDKKEAETKDKRDSIKSDKTPEKKSQDKQIDNDSIKEEQEPIDELKYNIEFTFDCDVRCAITVYYFATEEMWNGQMIYHPRDESMNSETYHYKRGANQTFTQASHLIQPSMFSEEDWQFSTDKDVIPVVIHCVVEEEENIGHSHMTFCTVEKTSDGYVLKPLKQKQMVDGLCYLLQEIYGIENKTTERTKEQQEEEYDDMGSECVICMSDIRDTLILPCRHLCLCNGCADSLRYQANNCPICRSPFRALLQVRSMRKKLPNSPEIPSNDEYPISQEGVPAGYEAVSLIEALNGPIPQPVVSTVQQDEVKRQPSSAGSPQPERKRSVKRLSASSTSLQGSVVPEENVLPNHVDGIAEEITDGRGTPEVVMSGEHTEPVKGEKEKSKKRQSSAKKKVVTKKPADSVKIVNELNSEKESDDSKDDDLVLGAEAATTDPAENTQQKSGVEEGDMPAAHAGVIYDTKDETDDKEEFDPLVHPLQTDPGSLPGTPLNDGSSFNSTSSTKALLPQHPYEQNKHQDKDPVV